MTHHARRRPRDRQRGRGAGFTLIELMTAIALIGVIAGLSITSYLGYVDKARVARAVAEIVAIATVIDGLTASDVPVPDSLADVDSATNDPWGNPYQYLRIEGMGFAAVAAQLPPVSAPGGSQGGSQGGGGGPTPKPRKDQFLKPINSDYDLYSMGADGQSQATLNANASRDDVVRALDGAYVGLAGLF